MGREMGREKGRRKAGGWTATRAESRWGCFLPDLTRFASGTSAANLPAAYITIRGGRRKAGRRKADGPCRPRYRLFAGARPEADEEAEAQHAEERKHGAVLQGALDGLLGATVGDG